MARKTKCPPKEPTNQKEDSVLESEFENFLEQSYDQKRKKREQERRKWQGSIKGYV